MYSILFIIIIICNELCATDYSPLDDDHHKYNKIQILSIENNLKLSKKGNEVEEVRRIVTYLKNELKWNQKEIAEKFKVSESTMTNFFKHGKNPLCLIDAVRHFYISNPTMSLVSQPVVLETHWYDSIINLFQRPDSQSSSQSKKSERSLGYLKEETAPFIKKEEKKQN
ncbi:MAG: hypothetical protein FADNKDHG_01554 [Holosporales bacterium]